MGRNVLSAIGCFTRSRARNHRHLLGKSIVLMDVRWLSWLTTGLVGKHTITARLRGYADTVGNQKRLPLPLLTDLIVTASAWQKITKTGSGRKTTGIGKAVSLKNKAVIAYMMAIRNGGKQCSSGMGILVKNVGIIKAVYWLPIISKNERTTPTYCSM